MDDLLREFLTETNESLDTVDVELVRFEREPNNAEILGNLFRLVHTIKGTCGFLELPRLEVLAHAAEALMGKFRDGMPVTREAVTAILACIDRIKEILRALEATGEEPAGADPDLIGELERVAVSETVSMSVSDQAEAAGPSVQQVLQRRPQPGEVSLDELERAFRETAAEARHANAPFPPGAAKSERKAIAARSDDDPNESRIAAQSIRVNVDTLEYLMTMVSELVLTRNQLLEIARSRDESEFKVPLQRLSNVTAELQDGVMKTRMQPIGNAWQKLPRIVRDLASELGKDIDLQMFGADTELDRQVLDLIKDPLTHMVRNSADHGLETPAERRALGKPPKGTIRLSAFHEGGYIVIDVADDGRGLNTEKIKAKAIAAGLASEAEIEKMTEAMVQKLIFAPGLSTASAVTSVSGRGVGMDVVKTNIDEIGGTVDVKSVLGAGTSFAVKIPLTLAIVSALIVEAGRERFAIPQLAVIELVRAQANSEHRIERIKGTPLLRLRSKLLPLVHLGSLLGIDAATNDVGETGFIVVTQVGRQTFGIVVDGVFHTEEIVVKPMSSKLRRIAMFSGNTILGDGSVIMIIDPNGIAEGVGASSVSERESAATEVGEENDGGQKTALLVFRAGAHQLKAVPLSLVTRLEEIDCATIESANGRHVVQYRGRLMPLVRIDAAGGPRRQGKQPTLVFSEAGRSMGLMVEEIVDIVEERLVIEIASETPGVIGSAIVRGKATEIVDVGHFLPLAFEDWLQHRDMGRRAGTPKLLLVDDSAFFRNMLPPVLQAGGYEVIAAAGAREALEILRTEAKFEAIVCDIEMPGMNGLQLAQAVRADERLTRIPLIALSSYATPALLQQIHAAGFRDFVAKFDRPGLIGALKALTVEMDRAA